MRLQALPFCLLVAALAPSPARAQAVEVYATFSPTHLSGVRNGNSLLPTINNGYTSTSFWTPGVGGGVTFNVLPLGPLKLGIDLRGSTMPGTNGSDTALAGIKLGASLPAIRLKPYVQVSGGYLSTRTRVTTGAATGYPETDKFAAYELFGGLDYSFLPFFNLRLIEAGAGRGYNVSGIGDTAGNYQVTIFTLNTGVVFHF